MILFPSLDRLRNRSAEPGARDTERARTYPAPYPTGWYHVLDSDEVERGRATRVECLGESRVVFRSDVDGRVAAVDEHCPHLGASLHGAPVVGGCVECPFHRWRVAGDGQVREVPYEAAPRPGLRARAWPARELHGMVFVYHAFSGEGAEAPATPRTPTFDLEPVADIEDGRLAFRGTYDAGFVRMHLLEFADNSADTQHFATQHGDLLVPFLGWRVPFVTV